MINGTAGCCCCCYMKIMALSLREDGHFCQFCDSRSAAVYWLHYAFLNLAVWLRCRLQAAVHIVLLADGI